jgi:predicted DNA binding CopG/RHH family protein
MKKRVPRLRSDEAAEAFLDQDLSDYIQPEHMVPLRYVRSVPKAGRSTCACRRSSWTPSKTGRRRKASPYQRFIRLALEQALAHGRERARVP